jgi:FkbM family methyltransferase
MKKIKHKLKFGAGIIKEYKTWLKAFVDYLGLIKKNKLIIHKMKKGAKYLSRAGTEDFGIINEIYVVKEYDKLLKYIKENSIVIDIGAQMGVFSNYAALQKKNVKVYSYEPFEENFLMLNKNIKLNDLQGKIIPIKLGISGKKGEREFTLCDENTGGHGFYCQDGSKKIKINTITLKDVFESNKIEKCDYLKMDCEGAEYEIFYNTPKKYLDKIKSISMEYHKNGDVNKLKKFLEENGFKVSLTEVGEGMLYAEKNGI